MHSASKLPLRKAGPVLLALGVVGAAVLLLAIRSDSGGTGQPPVAEPGPPDPDPAAPVVVPASRLITEPDSLRGLLIRVNGLPVADTVAAHGAAPRRRDRSRGGERTVTEMPPSFFFWVRLPNVNPFLVRSVERIDLASGDTLDVTGYVTPLTSALVDGWVASGSLSESSRLEVEFASHVFDAQSVVVRR